MGKNKKSVQKNANKIINVDNFVIAFHHEINQPLQANLGYSEFLLLSSKSDDLKDNKLNSIQLQALKLGEITKKLSNIAHYSTRDYPGNIKIVDIWSASIDAEQ